MTAPGDRSRALEVLIIGLNYAPEPSGIAPYTTGLAEGLVELGHRVRVLTGQPHYPWWRIAEGYESSTLDERRAGVDVHRIRPRLPSRPGWLSRAVMELRFGARVLCTPWGHPDHVVLVSPALFATGMAALAARLRGLDVTVWVQDIYSQGLRENGHARVMAVALGVVESRVLKLADSVVVIHDRFASLLAERLGVSPSRLHVVRNWSHVGEPKPVDRNLVRRRLGWAPDEVVVLHTGAMGAKQGLENVLEAASLAARTSSRVRFVLVGDGTRRAELERSADPTARVTFMQPLPAEDYLEVLSSADVLLINERVGLREMCVPSKLTSYLSTGLPVLAATDVGSITADEVQRSGAGVRVDAGDPKALLEAAAELGADPARSAELGRRGVAFRGRYLDERSAVRHFEVLLKRGTAEDALLASSGGTMPDVAEAV